MNELNFNTDDNFIHPSGRKNLEQLFDVEIQPTKGDESLRYVSQTAINKNTNNEQETRFLWQTLIAKVVLGFRSGGESVGRVGLAILRNIENAHRIILYKSKSNMLSTLSIKSGFGHRTYLHRQKCYWQFYDDAGEFWSLLFDRSTDETEFVSKLQECGIRMHLDVNLQPETVKTEEITKNDRIEKLQTANEVKHVRIKEDNNIEQIPVEEKTAYKEKLISRLPKMGGQQLPTLNEKNNYTTEGSDESDQESGGSSLTVVGQPLYPCTQLSTQIFPFNQNAATGYTVNTTTGSASNNVIMQPIETQVMQMLLVENRTQNTELRINMDKLEGKLEKVIEKIDNIQHGQKLEDELLKLEEQVLELKKENRRLKNEYREISERSDTSLNQIWKIYDEELNSLGLSLETNVMQNTEALVGELIDRIASQQNQLREKDAYLKSALKAAKDINDKYQQEKKLQIQTTEKLDYVLKKMKCAQTTLDEKENIETELNERINKLKTKHGNEITNIKVEMTQTVKDIMNNLYHNLAKNIVDMDRLVPEDILALIGKTIRQDTLAAVAKISK